MPNNSSDYLANPKVSLFNIYINKIVLQQCFIAVR